MMWHCPALYTAPRDIPYTLWNQQGSSPWSSPLYQRGVEGFTRGNMALEATNCIKMEYRVLTWTKAYGPWRNPYQ